MSISTSHEVYRVSGTHTSAGRTPRPLERPLVRCDATASVAFHTSMCRPHDVTEFSAPTGTSLAAVLQRQDGERAAEHHMVARRLPQPCRFACRPHGVAPAVRSTRVVTAYGGHGVSRTPGDEDNDA